MIKINNVSKKYKDKLILNEINYCFENTGLYVIKGYNGCGKTTLLSIIALIDINYSGEIIIDDQHFDSSNLLTKDKYRKKNISYILPSNNLISFLSIKDNILLESNNLIDPLLNGIDLDKNINQISGGQEMLVAISRFLNSNKSIGLLDEITSQLDEKNTFKIMERLIEVSKKKLIIFVSHDSRVLKMPGIKVLTLEGGKLHD